tara:strand:- start:5112 stop:6221 length:1110 start_codon:yes stop_codon:yes gene_type:complete
MSHIDTHLHRLFLDHDCVIVPGLGGFVCNRIPARYDALREELVPPAREVMFNERLIHHDGVLAQAVAVNEGLVYAEAMQAIEKEAGDLKQRVQVGETVTIDHVGRLYRGQDGGMMFMPEEVLERMLRSFGLQRIPLRPLVKPEVMERESAKIFAMPPAAQRSGMHPWARVAAAMAVPILGGVGMFIADQWQTEVSLMSALPSFYEQVESSAFQPRFEEEAVLSSGISTEPVFGPAIDAVEGASVVHYDFTSEALSSSGVTVMIAGLNEGVSEELAWVEETAEPEMETTAAVSAEMFVLVAGAFSVEDNALRLAQNLRGEGFNAEIFLQSNGLHVVSYAAFDAESDAREKLGQLRQDQRWATAWLKRFQS